MAGRDPNIMVAIAGAFQIDTLLGKIDGLVMGGANEVENMF
jgi:hypothetical protein